MARPVGVMSVTPFTAAGALDLPQLAAHLRRLGAHPVDVYVCSQGSGEGLGLSLDEKEAVYRTAHRVLGGRRTVVGAGVGLTGDTDSAVAQVQRLSATGVDAIQVFPPRTGALRPRDRELAGYYAEVVRVARCPVVLGENVTLVGYELGPALIDRLLTAHEEITGLSYTAPVSLGRLVDLVTAWRDRVQVRTGWLHHLTTMAAVGGAGVLCFDGNVAPGLPAAAWDAVRSGDGEAVTAVRLLGAVNALLSRHGNPASIKAALDHLGLPGGGALRRPLLGLPGDERAALGRGLDALMADGLDRWL